MISDDDEFELAQGMNIFINTNSPDNEIKSNSAGNMTPTNPISMNHLLADTKELGEAWKGIMNVPPIPHGAPNEKICNQMDNQDKSPSGGMPC